MSTPLDLTLYDERLSNDQRLTISALMNSEDRKIVSARMATDYSDGPRLFAKLSSDEHVRIDPNGNAWVLS